MPHEQGGNALAGDLREARESRGGTAETGRYDRDAHQTRPAERPDLHKRRRRQLRVETHQGTTFTRRERH